VRRSEATAKKSSSHDPEHCQAACGFRAETKEKKLPDAVAEELHTPGRSPDGGTVSNATAERLKLKTAQFETQNSQLRASAQHG